LVREIESDDEVFHSMAEFFIMRKYRRLGLGRVVAINLFERFEGQWRCQHPNFSTIRKWNI